MRFTLVISAISLSLFGGAEAADIPDEPESAPMVEATDEWIVSTAPYFWALFYEGDMTVNGQTIDMSGINVFDLLDAGDLAFVPFVNYLEVRKGRWGGYLDTTVIGLDFATGDVTPGPVGVSANLDFTYALVNAGLIYTVAEWSQPGSTIAFDLMGGGRYTYYDIELSIAPPIAGSPFSDTLDWWDITLGARLRGEYDNGWNFTVLGDIGGLGIESDVSAQALATIGRDFRLGRVDLAAIFGYRLLYQDWSDGGDAVDLLSHGPLAGLRIKF